MRIELPDSEHIVPAIGHSQTRVGRKSYGADDLFMLGQGELVISPAKPPQMTPLKSA